MVDEASRVAANLAHLYRLTPPIVMDDLLNLARAHAIEVKHEDKVPFAGKISTSDRRTMVELRSSDSPARRKFTLAHEIGHEVVGSRHLAATAEEERWCDEFANELLLPATWLTDRFANRRESLAAIDAISKAAQVSMPAALIRTRQILGWTSGLVTLRFSRNHWRVWATTGLSRKLGESLLISPEAEDEVATATSFARISRLEWKLNTIRVPIECEVIGSRDSRWVMLSSRAIAHLNDLI